MNSDEEDFFSKLANAETASKEPEYLVDEEDAATVLTFLEEENLGKNPSSLFKLEKEIGKGAFGKIYRATRLDGAEPKTSAIKVMSVEKGNTQVQMKLTTEVEILKASRVCKNIVQYFGSYIETKKRGNQYLWITMELLDCGSLIGYLANKPFGESAIANIMERVLKGVAFLHDMGMAHRDIKCGNILWNSNGEVRLADLGEVLVLSDELLSDEELFAGTPHYMAPEITLGEQYNGKVDLWSLGITAIECAEQYPPFYDDSPFMILHKVATGDFVPALRQPAKFSSDFQDWLSHCLEYNPAKRWNAKQLLEHPFITKRSDDTILVTTTREFLETFKDKPRDDSEHNLSTAGSRESLDSQDLDKFSSLINEDGETITDFLEGLVAWRDTHNEILDKLSQRTKKLKGLTPISDSSKVSSIVKSVLNIKANDLDYRLERWRVLVELAAKLSSDFGVLSTNRFVNSKYFENCFLGRECVDWIYENLQLPQRSGAIQLAIHLIQANLILGISSTHHLDADSNNAVYRFNYQKIREWKTPVRPKQKEVEQEEVKPVRKGTLRENKKEAPSSPSLGRNSGELPTHSSNSSSGSVGSTTSFSSYSTFSVFSDTVSFTERDWQLILSGAVVQTFNKGDIIVEEGEYNRYLHRIKQGNVVVQKMDNGSPKTLAIMTPGQMFGEMSVLTQGKTSATLRADATPTEIYSADVNFMYNLFKTEPGMQRRFFQYAAIKLAKKLKELGGPKKVVEASQEDSPESAAAARDRRFVEIFNLKEKNAVVIQEASCYVKGLVKEHGKLYISQNLVCFHSQVFGKQTKVVLKMSELLDISFETAKRKLRINSKKKKLALKGLVDPERTCKLIESLRSSAVSRTMGRDGTLRGTKQQESSQQQGEILTADDWNTLLKGAQCKAFQKDQVIVNEGARATKIYQIAKGTCRVTKGQEKKVLGKMESGEIFGEISFLEGGIASASVVADEENTEMYVMEGTALKILFVRQPALAGRFYRYLATILSTRLRDREASNLK